MRAYSFKCSPPGLLLCPRHGIWESLRTPKFECGMALLCSQGESQWQHLKDRHLRKGIHEHHEHDKNAFRVQFSPLRTGTQNCLSPSTNTPRSVRTSSNPCLRSSDCSSLARSQARHPSRWGIFQRIITGEEEHGDLFSHPSAPWLGFFLLVSDKNSSWSDEDLDRYNNMGQDVTVDDGKNIGLRSVSGASDAPGLFPFNGWYRLNLTSLGSRVSGGSAAITSFSFQYTRTLHSDERLSSVPRNLYSTACVWGELILASWSLAGVKSREESAKRHFEFFDSSLNEACRQWRYLPQKENRSSIRPKD